jgi:archaellum component FlaC
MHPRLQAFMEVAPFLKSGLIDDAAVAVADTEKFIFYSSGKSIDVKVKPGMPIGDDAISKAMRQNRTIHSFVPAEVYGVPFMAIGAPIHDEYGKVIGAYGYAINLSEKAAMEQKIKSMSADLASAMQEIAASVQQVNSNTEQLTTYFAEIVQKANSAKNLLDNIDGILKFVQSVGNKTNLIGLNAAIEAARAGEAGRSFKIVANEIRDLAIRSKQSIEEITNYLHDIHTEVEDMAVAIQANESYIQEQSASMEEVAASISQISHLAEELQEISGKLVKA